MISNAAKFTKVGRVDLEITEGRRNKETKQIEILFSITDTGIGISPELQKKLFSPFVQVLFTLSFFNWSLVLGIYNLNSNSSLIYPFVLCKS
jgi:K+-sensing histidine kinase KdpD